MIATNTAMEVLILLNADVIVLIPDVDFVIDIDISYHQDDHDDDHHDDDDHEKVSKRSDKQEQTIVLETKYFISRAKVEREENKRS